MRSVLGVHWKDWCWSWNSNPLATWWEELTHLKRLWCWERLKVGGKEDDRWWDGWMASLTRWTWVWVNSRSLWWTEKPCMLQSMGSQRVRHDWVTELNWTPDFPVGCVSLGNSIDFSEPQSHLSIDTYLPISYHSCRAWAIAESRLLPSLCISENLQGASVSEVASLRQLGGFEDQ